MYDNIILTIKIIFLIYQPKGEEEYEFTLTMKKFDESYQDYHLTVTNSMGTVTKTITLTKKSGTSINSFYQLKKYHFVRIFFLNLLYFVSFFRSYEEEHCWRRHV